MKKQRRKMTTAAAGLLLTAGLAGCSLFPSPPPPPVVAPAAPTSLLPANCPFLGPEQVLPVRIPQGTPQEAVGSVLNSYGAWLNAGSEVLSTWQAGGTVPRECVDGLAAANADAYATTVFTSHGGDVAWQQYFAAVERMNAQALQGVLAQEPGAAQRGTFELLKVIDTSSTDNGTFLKFDAVYRPATAGTAGRNWEDWDRPTRWYVELVPAGEFLAINYVEQAPAAGYP